MYESLCVESWEPRALFSVHYTSAFEDMGCTYSPLGTSHGDLQKEKEEEILHHAFVSLRYTGLVSCLHSGAAGLNIRFRKEERFTLSEKRA